MNIYLANLNWEIIKQLILSIVILGMFFLFKKPSLYSQKALKIGMGIFISGILFNMLGLTEISDYFSVIGFTVIFMSLLRIFWADTSVSK